MSKAINRVRILTALLMLCFLSAAGQKADKLARLEQAFKVATTDSAKARTGNALMFQLGSQQQNRLREVAPVVNTAITKLSNAVLKLRLINDHALALKHAKLYPEGIAAARNGVALAKMQASKENLALLYTALAEIDLNLGRHDQMVLYIDSAIASMPPNDPVRSGTLRRDLGRMYYEMGNFEKAMKLYLAAQKDYDAAKYNGPEQAHLLHYIGSVFKRQNNDARALEYYGQMLDLGIALKDTAVQIEAMDLSADLLMISGKQDSAVALGNRAVQLASTYHNPDLYLLVLMNSGHVTYSLGKFDQAETIYKQALEVAEKHGINDNDVSMHRYLGGLYSKTGRHELAIAELNKALEMAEASPFKRTLYLSEVYSSLAFAYSRKGDFETAFDRLLDHMDYKDSLINEQNINVITDLEQRYESEKKEAEIKLLNLDKEVKEKEISKQRIIKNLFIGGFLLALLLIGGIYYSLNKNRKKNVLITKQKELVEKKNHEITESIKYARRLQEAVLPPAKVVKEFFTDSFLLYLPRDIVSGDFYWMESYNSAPGKEEPGVVSYFAIGDCTGYGVPGAMLSVMGLNGLNRALNELGITQPKDMLTQLNLDFHAAFEHSATDVRDGMDIVLCALNLEQKVLTYAGANNALWIYR